ncbi:MAG: tRNA (adenosine(37)-N6)-threonylcarbamoyltransferase complex dimerization subunit type 1 TsaB [Lachnospiraceae bacterium]|nr:tRNA (adenosine(37)-N6)-threonylcarbamoyltransferase complex dimerization subunit type 1 TsaB [Lachnospiraceae bacterium]
MRILGIESAAVTASVAIVTEEAVLAEYTVSNKLTHSQTLLPMIDAICRMADVKVADLSAIAVSGGPGSFTGLRIGSATAKGLGLAADKPLVHVPTVDAMAYQAYGYDGVICPMMDARRDQVYCGIYAFEEKEFRVLLPQAPRSVEEILEELARIAGGRRVLLMGEGVPVHREAILAALGERADLAPPHLALERGAAVAALGLAMYLRGETETAAEHAPEYLRPSQAERVRAEKAQTAGKAADTAVVSRDAVVREENAVKQEEKEQKTAPGKTEPAPKQDLNVEIDGHVGTRDPRWRRDGIV